jgi:hypothetical protein
MMTTLLSPIQLGDLLLRNRIFMAPLTRSRATGDHLTQPDLMERYYRQRATARPYPLRGITGRLYGGSVCTGSRHMEWGSGRAMEGDHRWGTCKGRYDLRATVAWRPNLALRVAEGPYTGSTKRHPACRARQSRQADHLI